MSRLQADTATDLKTKISVYDGIPMKEKDPSAKTLEEYLERRPDSEGFEGTSTRDSFKILASVFDKDAEEQAADPVNLFKSIKGFIQRGSSSPEESESSLAALELLMDDYKKLITDDIQTAYLDCGDEFCQAEFERYLIYARHYIERQDYRDEETGELITMDQLEKELAKIEDPAGVSNKEKFRYDVAHFAMKVQIEEGKMPRWNEYEKLARIIKERMRVNTESMLPVISFSKKRTNDQDSRHSDFVKRMMELGYTKRQVRRVVEWQLMRK
jgi:serine protein kinase